MDKSELELINSHRTCVAEMQSEKQGVVDILLPGLIPLRYMSYPVWIGGMKIWSALVTSTFSESLSPLSLSVSSRFIFYYLFFLSVTL